MIRYKNLSGDSGVYAFETGSDFIKVQFKGGATYLYNYIVTGINHIETMKRMAINGRGLSAYISTYVKNKYASKLR
ncbi:MAG: hypothetical protein NVV82_22795 [Sporocytophaga sp.]|nr:hypothetical protein [Sporocytophaga sp.]